MPVYTASHHTKLQLNIHPPTLPESKCHHHYNKITPQHPLFKEHTAHYLYTQEGALLFPVKCDKVKEMANLPLSMPSSERRFLAPLNHNLTTRWRQVVNFLHHPLYEWAKKPWYPLNRSGLALQGSLKLFVSARTEP